MLYFGELADAIEYKSNQIAKLKEPSARFRSIHYKNVANIIRQKYDYKTKITETKIDNLPITENMKIFCKTNNLDSNNLVNDLCNIKGIGVNKANQLIDAGLKNISQLRTAKFRDMLSKETNTILDNTPLDKIPNNIIYEIEQVFKKIFTTIKFVFVGSYRRKKEFSRDIDIMFVTNKIKISEIIDYISKKFKIIIYSIGESKASLIIVHKNIKYKMDIFITTKDEEIPMKLYSTGSKEFNIMMRAKAKKLGYLLNQKGLFKDGEKIKLTSEKSYFEILKLEYVKPENR